MRYTTEGTCAKFINFDVVGDRLCNVSFEGGCSGNLQAIGRLVEGMPINEAISKLEGLTCGMRGTSCSDQLSKALKKALNQNDPNKPS
jgi:uncharacterized protein (TIGR03905 family)